MWVHISKHSLFRLKITVGCLTSTYPSIHVETPSRSRSVVDCAHIRAFTFLLTKTLSRSRSVVWFMVCCVLCVCVHVVLCCGVGGVCVVVLWWCVCVVCGEAWHTLSLLLSSLLSFVSSSYLYFSLFFFFFFFSCSFSCSCSCYFSFSSLSPLLATNQPTRRPTSRHLNVIWRRASALQSVPSLLPSPPPLLKNKEEEGTFYYRNIFRRGIYFLLRF